MYECTALFAIGIADALSNINARLQALTPNARVFSYLDDVIVAAPSEHAAAAANITVEELKAVGLEINVAKTTAWTNDPPAPLPEALASYRVPTFKCLGAHAPWLDNEDPLSGLPVHHATDGEAAVREAARFRERLAQLRASGLGNQLAFQLLQAYSAGCVTHLLRANFEEGPWLQRLDDTWLAIVQDIVGDPLPQDRRKQLFLRLADGGLGLTSAMETAPVAFLASWAFVLPEVAATVGAVS